MRTKLRGKFTLLFMTFAVLLAVPAIALADNISNNIDGSIDTVAETMPLTVGGTNGTTQLYVQATGADGKPGCNLTGSTTLGLSVSSSNTSVATVSPSSVTFASCGDVKPLMVTPVAAGSATISVSQTSNNTGGTFNLAPAAFTVNVTPPPNTAPTVTVGGVAGGAAYEKGSVPKATCNVTDTEDGNSSFDATLSSVSGPLASYGLGLQTATCSYTDKGPGTGLQATSSETYTIVDTTAPELAAHADVNASAANASGATVNYNNPTATDAVDPNPQVSCSPASGSTFGLGDTTVTCTAKDAAGNEATSTFKVTVADKTAPDIASKDDVTAEATGSNGAVVTYTKPAATDNVDASVTVNCSPASGSQFALGSTEVTCAATDAAGNKATSTFDVIVKDTTAPSLTVPSNPVVVEATGPTGAVATYQVRAEDAVDSAPSISCTPASGNVFGLGTTPVTCTAKDAAGNTSAQKTFDVTVQDTIAPNNIQFVGNINDGDSFFFGDVPAQPTCTATDSGSGLDSCVVTGYSTAVGNQTLTATATDKAGNAFSKTLSYTVKPYSFNGFYQPVDMSTATTTVYNTVKGGSTVPLKFELFKGTTELTSTSYINQPLRATRIICASGAEEDTIELLATGGTSLRYDSTGGQYIYNWKTPTGIGCYKVTVSATDGSSSITAYFKTK